MAECHPPTNVILWVLNVEGTLGMASLSDQVTVQILHVQSSLWVPIVLGHNHTQSQTVNPVLTIRYQIPCASSETWPRTVWTSVLVLAGLSLVSMGARLLLLSGSLWVSHLLVGSVLATLVKYLSALDKCWGSSHLQGRTFL